MNSEQAIKQGVMSSFPFSEDISNAISDGVREAVDGATAGIDMHDLIYMAINNNMPSKADIISAIESGTYQAMKEK